MSAWNLARVSFLVVVLVLFLFSLKIPARQAEAAAALASVDACHTGDAVAAHQSGEHESRRLPLHIWISSSLAGWRSDRVDTRAARWISFLAIVLAAGAGSAAFGSRRLTTPAVILVTPAVWSIAIRGTPAALLALLVTLGWASYEAGRRLRAPTLQWALPPVLAAAASLVWAPAGLFVAIALLIEACRLAARREVSWPRLVLGSLIAVAMIGLWQMAYTGFAADAPGWWARVVTDLVPGDPVLAARAWTARVTVVAGVLMPAVVLAVIGGWPPYLSQPRMPGETRLGAGTVVAAVAATLSAVALPGVPHALVLPAGVAALSVLGRGPLVSGPGEKSRRVEAAVVVGLTLLVAFDVAHSPRRQAHLNLDLLDVIEERTVVVADRDLDPRDTWRVASRLGRPLRRGVPRGEGAWYVGPSVSGPGLSIEGPRNPEAWSLLARPLDRATLDPETARMFETNLAAARAAHEADPSDKLAEIWVGRRLAYLGRYGKAIEWYGQAMEKHGADARLWRHRGHRYISVREFAKAIRDLERAAELESRRPDRVEPDGLPNAAGIPRSTTQTNIWYHLGLAYYLSGDLEQTARCYRQCVELSPNDDMWVAAAHWLHIALRQLGLDDEAAALLDGLRDDMEILENHSYYQLLRLYAGEIRAEDLQRQLDEGDGPSQAALAYGLARWYEDSGDAERARASYRGIVEHAPWAAFGAIAAEAELARRLRREIPVW